MLHHSMHSGSAFGSRNHLLFLHKRRTLDDWRLKLLDKLITDVLILKFKLPFYFRNGLLGTGMCCLFIWVCIRKLVISFMYIYIVITFNLIHFFTNFIHYA